MENEFLDSATRVVLSMAAALLLHHSEVINELHDKVEQCFRRMGASPVIYQQSPALSSTARSYGADSVRPRTPMSDSYIDQLEASRTIHIDDSPAPRSRAQRSVVPSNRSYIPTYDTLDGRSYRRSGSSSVSPQDQSVSVIRRRVPARRRLVLEQSDDTPPSTLMRSGSPRRVFRAHEITPTPRIPRYILSPGAPVNEAFRLTRSPQTIPRAIEHQARRGGNFTSIEPSLYRSYIAGQMPPLVQLRPLQRLHPGSLTSPVLSFAKSLNVSSPLRSPAVTSRVQEDPTEEDLDGVEFPSGYLSSTMEESNNKSGEISRPLRSSPAQNLPSKGLPNVSVEENLEDVEFPSGSFLTSSMELTNPMDETINTLFNRINRQAAILQAGGQITPRRRIGIMRRNSDDFDFETGRMRSLPPAAVRS